VSIRLSVRTAPSENILDMVLQEEVQVGLAWSLQHPNVESVPLFDEEFVFAVGASHPLADVERVTLADLADDTVITLFRSPTYRLYIRALLRRSGVPLHGIIDLDNAEAGKRMLEDAGVGLLPHMAIRAELDDGTMRRLEIADIPPLRRTMVALRRRGAPEHAVELDFLDTLRGQLDEMKLTVGAARSMRRAKHGPGS
jgi:DNA-binding transcriptional LysR family regulator